MMLPLDSRTIYFDWLVMHRSYQAVADKYGTNREAVYKRVNRYEARLSRGCTCRKWKCLCAS
jgi:predicted DNA-binding protein YlxM (UPF0122 family)